MENFNKILHLSKLLGNVPIINIENGALIVIATSYKLASPSNHIHQTIIDKGVDVTDFVNKEPIDSYSESQIKAKIMDLPNIHIDLSIGMKYLVIKSLQQSIT